MTLSVLRQSKLLSAFSCFFNALKITRSLLLLHTLSALYLQLNLQ